MTGSKPEEKLGEFANKPRFCSQTVFHLNPLNQSKSQRTAWLHDAQPDILILNC